MYPIRRTDLYDTDFDGLAAKLPRFLVARMRTTYPFSLDAGLPDRRSVCSTIRCQFDASCAFLQNHNKVLTNVRQAAVESKRVFAVMYDLTGITSDLFSKVEFDWVHLQSELAITKDAGYLHHQGKPLVAIWGVGFNDNRKYSLKQCYDLVATLKQTGCAVMLGVPSFWREGNRDALDDPMLHEIIKMSDIVSPWSVGRYRSPTEAKGHARQVWRADLDWCQKHRIDFLPVVFPGFSWRNLHGGPLNEIPRQKGEFLWSQITAAKSSGAKMIYVAMFDEVDEATAIFKCTNPPTSDDRCDFVDYEGLPSDFYLKIVGQAGRLLRDEPDIRTPSDLQKSP